MHSFWLGLWAARELKEKKHTPRELNWKADDDDEELIKFGKIMKNTFEMYIEYCEADHGERYSDTLGNVA